jgi:hypothetical protein
VDRAPIAVLLDEVRIALGHVASASADQRTGGAAELARARAVLETVASRLDPRIVLGPEAAERGAAGEAVVVLMLRPLVIDLLMATGMSHAEARARLVEP